MKTKISNYYLIPRLLVSFFLLDVKRIRNYIGLALNLHVQGISFFFFLKFVFWLHVYNADLNCGFLSSLFMIMASNMGPSRTTNSIMRWIRISRFLWRDQKQIRNLFTGKNPQFHLSFSIDWDLNLWIFAQKLEIFFF